VTTTMRVVLLVLVLAAIAGGIWFGTWLWARVTEPDPPPSPAAPTLLVP
jgi:hypothetical protein